eukprot:3892960-Rhodomonas_salina.2
MSTGEHGISREGREEGEGEKGGERQGESLAGTGASYAMSGTEIAYHPTPPLHRVRCLHTVSALCYPPNAACPRDDVRVQARGYNVCTHVTARNVKGNVRCDVTV